MQNASPAAGIERRRAHSPAPARAPRMVRGLDKAGKVIFSVPASKVERPSARKAMDLATVKARHAILGGRLARVEVDERAGGTSAYLVASDGALKPCITVDGFTLSFN